MWGGIQCLNTDSRTIQMTELDQHSATSQTKEGQGQASLFQGHLNTGYDIKNTAGLTECYENELRHKLGSVTE